MTSYRPQNLANFWTQARATTGVWLLVFFILAIAAFSFKVTEIYSRGATLTFLVAGWAVIMAWRFVVSRLVGHALEVGAFAEQKVLLFAEEGQLAGTSIVDEITRCGYTPVRTLQFAQDSFASTSTSSDLARSIAEINTISRSQKINCVFLLASWNDRNSIEQIMERLRIVSIPIYLLPDRNVAHFLRGRIVSVGTAWTAELKRAPLTAAERICKRAIDLLIASAALIMLAPMMIMVGVLIKMEGGGPVFFRQTRIGFNGRPFKMCKFRTMSVLEDGPVIQQATKNDPRVTRFGGLLRRTSIDELPQFFNVLLGDMSVIGPRPHASAHNSEYENIIAKYAHRYHVKPGLTGWAQVNGWRGETQTVDLMEKRVEFDLWYIENWSLWLDIRILLRTLFLGLQQAAY